MKAVLMLDWHFLCKQFKIFFILILCYAAAAIMSGNVAYIAFTLLFLCLLPQYMMLASADGKQDVFLLLMPVDRTAIVRERYLTALLALLLGLVVTGLVGLVQGLETMLPMLILLGEGIVAQAFAIPFTFQFGVQARIPLLVVLGALFGGSGAAFPLLSDAFVLDTGTLLFWLSVGAPVAGVLLLALSYPISLKILNGREY